MELDIVTHLLALVDGNGEARYNEITEAQLEAVVRIVGYACKGLREAAVTVPGMGTDYVSAWVEFLDLDKFIE